MAEHRDQQSPISSCLPSPAVTPGRAAGRSHALAAKHCVPQLSFQGRRGARGIVGCVGMSCTRETSPSLAPIAERFKAGSGSAGCAWGPAITHPSVAECGGEGQPVLHCTGAASRPPGPRAVMQGRCRFGLWKSPFLSGSERFC